MSLRPPTPLLNQSFSSLDSLLKALQEYAGSEGYAVTKKRTKNNPKTNLPDTCYFVCDRGRKIHIPKGQRRIHGSSRTNECPFSVVAKYREDMDWYIRDIRDSSHNHEATCRGSHPSLRKLALTEDVQKQIAQATRIQQKPGQIVTAMRLQDETNDDNNPIFKRHDIYNAKAAIRRETLGPLTPTQALLRELEQGPW